MIRYSIFAIFFVLAIYNFSCKTAYLPQVAKQSIYACAPQDPCWPKASEWQKFAALLDGDLVIPESPLLPCKEDAKSNACALALKNLSDPFFVESRVYSTQSTGWLDAWTSSPSAYAVVAKNTKDIIAAVNFAREHSVGSVQ